MKNLKQFKKHQGFTIIEVMIVLAIAALMLLVVFLAVPNLQRSQRNNARKSDGSRVAAAVVDFTSNNSSGSLPSTSADCTTLVNSTTSLAQYTGLTCVAAATMPASVNASSFYIIAGASGATIPAGVSNTLVLADSAQCGASNNAGTPLGAGTPKQAALLYSLEQGGGNWTWGCVNPQ